MRDTSVSFTQKVKEEVATTPLQGDVARSFLSSFIQINGHITIRNRETILTVETENAKIAKNVYMMVRERYGVSLNFSYRKKMKFDKKVCYVLQVNEGSDAILNDLEIHLYEDKPMRTFLRKSENIRAFIAGAFLACGSCNDPHSSNYHLEIALQNEEFASYLLSLVVRNRYIEFDMKMIQRRKQCVLYLKKSDQISDFIAYIGAPDTRLRFEEIRVERDFHNNDNRLQICDTANLKRTLSSSEKQMKDIAIIERTVGIPNLINEKLRLLCELRKENEDASMLELAELLGERMNCQISKSNINHLFRNLHELAIRYGGDKNDN